MNIQSLCEHSIDLDLLPERPVVLDVGCRDYRWDMAVLAIRPGARIIACDADPTLGLPWDERISVMCTAVTGLQDPIVTWQGSGEGSYIADLVTGDGVRGWPVHNSLYRRVVSNATVGDIMRVCHVDFWDLVKLDCEGSEFNILEHWPGPIARQISVEFHDQMDPERWDRRYFEGLFAGPLRDYRVEKFALSLLAPDSVLGWGHWDSLLVLEEGIR